MIINKESDRVLIYSPLFLVKSLTRKQGYYLGALKNYLTKLLFKFLNMN